MKKIICKICGREIETETGRMRSHLKPTIPNVWCNGRKRRPTQRAIDAGDSVEIPSIPNAGAVIKSDGSAVPTQRN